MKLDDLPRFSKLDLEQFDFSKLDVPRLDIPNIDCIAELVRNIGPSPLIQNVEGNLASEFCKRLGKWISDFDASLDQAHEVGARLVSYGQTFIFHLRDIGYWNPSLMSFGGHTVNGEPVELIQHVSQISILLMRLPRQNPNEPKKSIGFHAIQESRAENHDG